MVGMTDTSTPATPYDTDPEFHSTASSDEYARSMPDEALLWAVDRIVRDDCALIESDQLAVMIEWHRRNVK